MDNDKSDRPERRTAFIARELRRLDVDIAALQETRLADDGQLTENGGGYTFFWKGKPLTEKRIYGVGFAIKTEIVRKLEQLPVGVNERLMTLQLNLCNNKKATLISAYAPTLMAEQHDKEVFYSHLDTLLSQVPRSNKIILLGDFNARIGRDHLVWDKVIGKDGTGKTNSNGEMLLTKCAEHKLTITNTLFRQKDRKKTSWRHPRSGHWHLIDYIVVRQADAIDVQLTRAVESSDACWTDHRLIMSLMSFKIQPKKRRTEKKITKYNTNKLNQPESKAQFQKALAERIKNIPNGSTDNIWNEMREMIIQTCDSELGKQERRNEDWFDDNDKEITSLMDKKRAAFRVWQRDYRNIQKKKDYHNVRSKVQTEIRKLKNDWWVRKSEEIQTLADMNCNKEFFAATRKIFGPSCNGVRPIASKDGIIHKDKEQIKARWGEHFSELLNQEAQVKDNTLDGIPQYSTLDNLSDPPTMEELEKAIRQTKQGKAAGPDAIPAEIYKNGGPELTQRLFDLFLKIWESETLPADLRNANIVTIFKKGNKTECGNYRGISLLSIAGKLLARIVSYRLNVLTTRCLPESQSGFRPNRGTVDMIFAARQIQEKCREQHQDLYMAFIDLTKAFDTVHRPSLWKVLSKMGCPDKLISIVRLLHDGMKASVIVDGDDTESFEVKTGVKQGCVIAPTLFSIFLTAVLHLVKESMPTGIKLRYRFDDIFNLRRLKAKTKTTTVTVCELQYADDNAIVAHSEQDLQQAMDAFNSAYTALGLKLNAKKTQVLCQARPLTKPNEQPDASIKANGIALDNVDTFNYLGSSLSTSASIDNEISRRLQAAGSAIGNLQRRVFTNKDISKNTKLKVYKAVVLPTLLYGSETWVTYRHNLRALEKFHDRTVRKILGIKWQDLQTTNSVFQQAKTTSIESMIIKNQLRWAGHVVRMEDHRLPKQIMYSELERGVRSQGGQRKRFKDTLHNSLKQCYINTNKWEQKARDRKAWRNTIHRGTKLFEERRRDKRDEKRAARKASQGTAAGITSAVDQSNPCPHCDKICRSRIGLISHLRTHK